MPMNVSSATSEAGGVGWPVMVRYKLTSLTLLAKPVWLQIRKLAGWLESEALPAARQNNEPMVVFNVCADGRITCDCADQSERPMALDGMEKLCSFLNRIGVDRLQLNHRLESNQITDILTLLYAYRWELAGARHGGA